MMRLVISGALAGHPNDHSSLLLSCGHCCAYHSCMRSPWPQRVACYRCQAGTPIDVDRLSKVFSDRDKMAPYYRHIAPFERRKPRALRAMVLELLPRCPWCRGHGGQNKAVCVACYGWGVGAWDIGWCHARVYSAENVSCLD